MQTSDNAVLGGRLTLRQPLKGHRVGHDAILLAAATGARAGEHAVEFGAGVGAAGLALAQREPHVRVTLAEIDPELCALAAHNAEANGLAARVRAVVVDVEEPAALAAAGLRPGEADRVLMNPPFNDPMRHTVSPDVRRQKAHMASPGLLPRWIASAASLLKAQGVLTLIWRADELDDVLAALIPAFGAFGVLAVYPREGAEAIRVLVGAVKGAAPDRRDHAPLVLNAASERPSAAAEAILRGGEVLPLAAIA